MSEEALSNAEAALRFRARQEEFAAQHAITTIADDAGASAERHRQRMIAFREAAALVRDLSDAGETPRRTFALSLARAGKSASPTPKEPHA